LFWAIGSQWVSALSWGHSSFELTEWLINYSGGFVRRGLPGSLIGIFSHATGIQANHLLIGFSLVCYLILAIWLLRRATHCFPAILILSCMVMGIPAYQNSIIRKDCLGLLLLVGCLAVNHGRHLPRAARVVGLNLLAGVAILSHETFVFYALAGLVLLRGRDQQSRRGIEFMRRGLSLLPAAGCFLLTVVFHGTPGQAEAVNASWMPLWRVIDPGNPGLASPSAAIQALGWTTREGLSLSLYLLTSGLYQPLAWVMVFGISFGLVILFTGHDCGPNDSSRLELRTKVAAILLAQFMFISPLFLLGVDYGRWLFLWLASSIILYTENRRAPVWLESWVARTFEKAKLPQMLGRLPAKDWYLLFFGVPVCWNLFNFMTASPIIRHAHLIWSWW
jgi:hypothetical protein